MPTPSRTSLDNIVSAGCDLLGSDGLAGLTMQAVAQRVGVKPPSLYKHVHDRDALIGLVANAVVAEVEATLSAAATLPELARALRQWALANPAEFALAVSGLATQEALAAASVPVLRVSADLVGDRDALAAARLVTAWCTGFLTMELGGAFQLGGDLDESFEFALERLTVALATR
jgi:AcrR family transcriptional regulator